MARLDDVINTAGHRISTGLLEQVVSNHPRVNECAVVGFKHNIKGECPFAFVVLKGTDAVSQQALDQLSVEIGDKVKVDVGTFAQLQGIIFANALPKTRSGKIMRGLIKSILNHEPYKFPATIDDPSTIETVTKLRDEYLKKT